MKLRQTVAWLRSHRVAVLKGGWSRERVISLKTGAAVEASFRRMKIPALSIDVKPGFEQVLAKNRIQFCFNALHGPYGEDGRIQGALDMMNISYSGSGVLASAAAMDKDHSKKLFRSANIRTPDWILCDKPIEKIQSEENIHLARKFFNNGPIFIKPVDQGSAIGASAVRTPGQIRAALNLAYRVGNRVMIERLIDGRELTVGILNDKPLPVIEIIPQHRFYDFHSKYAQGGSRHVLPAPLSRKKSLEAQALAKKAFHSLGCTAVGRVDFMMDKRGNLYVLEVNTIPGMTNTSLLPEAAAFVGINFDELVLRIVSASRGRK